MVERGDADSHRGDPPVFRSLCARQHKTARKNDRSSELLFSSKISTLTVLVPVRLV
jgi:hypothetical protein